MLHQIFITVMAGWLIVSGFFIGLPNMIMPWDKPGEIITDTAEVLELFQEIAAKNEDTLLMDRFKIEYDGFFSVEFVCDIIKGVPGAPQELAVADIASAKAEYYHGGRTVMVTITPVEQSFASGDIDIDGPLVRFFGEWVGQPDHWFVDLPQENWTLQSRDSIITLRADVNSGRIKQARFHFQMDFTSEELAASLGYGAIRP